MSCPVTSCTLKGMQTFRHKGNCNRERKQYIKFPQLFQPYYISFFRKFSHISSKHVPSQHQMEKMSQREEWRVSLILQSQVNSLVGVSPFALADLLFSLVSVICHILPFIYVHTQHYACVFYVLLYVHTCM